MGRAAAVFTNSGTGTVTQHDNSIALGAIRYGLEIRKDSLVDGSNIVQRFYLEMPQMNILEIAIQMCR
jgi:hypothetical protein